MLYWVCGLAVTAGIPVKFGTAHGRLRQELGSAKCIGAYGEKGVPRVCQKVGTSQQRNITPTIFLRPKQNFDSLTVCTLKQYLQNGSENKMLLS